MYEEGSQSFHDLYFALSIVGLVQKHRKVMLPTFSKVDDLPKCWSWIQEILEHVTTVPTEF